MSIPARARAAAATVLCAAALAVVCAAALAVSAAPAGAADADEPAERTWLGWASGFVAIIVVIGLTAAAVAWIRRRR